MSFGLNSQPKTLRKLQVPYSAFIPKAIPNGRSSDSFLCYSLPVVRQWQWSCNSVFRNIQQRVLLPILTAFPIMIYIREYANPPLTRQKYIFLYHGIES